MLECVLDSREQSLWEDLQQPQFPIPVRTEMLPLGDVLIQKQDNKEILLMLERKTVRDLIQSLRDGRYHDQRKRWLEFRSQSPQSFVSVWIEGDLLASDMDPVLKSSLINSLFRLQSKHHILVHHVRTRSAFVESLRMVVEKLAKDPYHLLPDGANGIGGTATTMNQYRKSAHSQEQYWQDCLTLVPGVSPQIAQKVQTIYPTLVSMTRALGDDPQGTIQKISLLQTSEKRKLGEKLAQKIVRHLDPSLSCLDQTR